MKKIYFLFISMVLGMVQLFGQAEFNTGSMIVNVNTYGRVRLSTPDAVRHLQRASILVGTPSGQVFDYNEDSEENQAPELVTPPSWGDFELFGSFDNTYSNNPPDVLVGLNAYGWTNKTFTVLKFNVKNIGTTAMTATVGLDIIPELAMEYGFDTVTYDASTGVVRFHRGTDMNMGMKLLSTSFTSLTSFEWFDGYMTDAGYWGWMNSGGLQARYVSNTADGPVTITAQAPEVINPNETMDVYYAFALGTNQSAMLAAIAEAQQKFDDLFSGLGDIAANPNALRLGYNHPNPFNGQTTISYHLPTGGQVTLKVFDQLGNEVAVAVIASQAAGLHSVDFDATGIAPGIYYYTLIFNEKRITNKMIISK